MTIVEFFDTDAVENIISTLACTPRRVILVGQNEGRMKKAKERYEKIAGKRGMSVVFEYRKAQSNNLQKIISVLREIVQTYGECAFDLTGGEDLYLVAVGIIFSEFHGKVQLHRFNVRNGKPVDCDADGTLITYADAALSIEENALVYGGRVIFDDEKANGTHRWNFDAEFCEDFETMWRICKKDVATWNLQIHTLDMVHRALGEDTSLAVCINKKQETERIEKLGGVAVFWGSLFQELERCGLIYGLRFRGDMLEYTYKNEQVKRCLTNAGRVLELFVLQTAKGYTDKDGNPVFTDALTGVVLDWDGKVAVGEQEVDNEIDVMLMRHLTPIFISCKNGRNFTSDELYKLAIVAERFGGKYARKVLVATQLEEMKERGDAIIKRAESMGIELVGNADCDAPDSLWAVFEKFI